MSDRLPEPDRLPYPRLVAVMFAVLALFGLAVFLSSRLQKAATDVPPAPIPDALGEVEINGVNQRPFENDQRARRSRREKLERLRSYGWVEPDAGVVHIPIDVAMDLLVDGGGR